MARERQEDGLVRHADALEKVGNDHLAADDEEDGHGNAESPGRQPNEFLIVRKERNGGTREEHAHDEARVSYDKRTFNGKVQHLQYAVVLFRAVVVAGNRLHALVEAHDDHQEKENQPVHDAVGADRQVAAIALELVVDENHHEARGYVHQERCKADRKRALRDAPVEAEVLARQVQELPFVANDAHDPHERHEL